LNETKYGLNHIIKKAKQEVNDSKRSKKNKLKKVRNDRKYSKLNDHIINNAAGQSKKTTLHKALSKSEKKIVKAEVTEV
jgi:hypothetical protein